MADNYTTDDLLCVNMSIVNAEDVLIDNDMFDEELRYAVDAGEISLVTYLATINYMKDKTLGNLFN